MATRDTTNATSIPVINKLNSNPVKPKPNLYSFKALAPNITGIDRKNEYSAAKLLDVPSIIAPIMVAPDLEVPGINANTWKIPIANAVP